jgi:hypothetical protein
VKGFGVQSTATVKPLSAGARPSQGAPRSADSWSGHVGAALTLAARRLVLLLTVAVQNVNELLPMSLE